MPDFAVLFTVLKETQAPSMPVGALLRRSVQRTPVSALGRRPRGLRLVEEVQQLPFSELREGCVGTPGPQRRIASEAALALGAGPELEQQPKLILPINGDAARGINLPDAAVYHDGGSCHTSHTRKEGGRTRPPPSPGQIGRPCNRPELRAA